MRPRLLPMLWIVLLAALAVSSAQAGPLATTNRALNDGFGPDAGRWHGSLQLAGGATGGSVAVVDWAVFARPDGGPGKFQQYLDDEAIAAVDPSGPGEVIYVYQIVAVGPAWPGIDALTVALDPADGRGALSAPAFVATGAAMERAPTGGGDNSTFMSWLFDPDLVAGETSAMLVFTSPFRPEFDFLAVHSGQMMAQGLVGSPSDRPLNEVPEPGLVWLFVAGVGAVVIASQRSGDLERGAPMRPTSDRRHSP